jgi:hypothetical protein
MLNKNVKSYMCCVENIKMLQADEKFGDKNQANMNGKTV